MVGFPQSVLLAHRLLFAGLILYMAPTIWRMFLRPVTMLSDFPATVFASTLILAGFLLCWLKGKAVWLLLACDALLILLAGLYFTGRS
jgi:uncharacterized protein YjeT (DUF2065 family)